jgi:hypothetical protein
VPKTSLVCHRLLSVVSSHQPPPPSDMGNPHKDWVNPNFYGLHILMILCNLIIYEYFFSKVLGVFSAYVIAFMTAKQVLLLHRYHVYGLALNSFFMLQKYTYSYKCGLIYGQLKTNSKRKNVQSIFSY